MRSSLPHVFSRRGEQTEFERLHPRGCARGDGRAPWNLAVGLAEEGSPQDESECAEPLGCRVGDTRLDREVRLEREQVSHRFGMMRLAGLSVAG